MNSLDALFKADATALSLRQKRLEILGSNIANAATPHFKARDIDFEAAYKSAMNSGELTKTASAHIDVGGTAQSAEVRYRVPLSPSLDGNTVELHVEQLQFAENATHYEATLNFLNGRINSMRKALKGE
ncbi:MAG: flagellar basal body rod protein FlgB [Alphaproteobacteria bacterium]|nr:flagellar basal body rod protein FlgB [Alphaproteobacteria bacterium]